MLHVSETLLSAERSFQKTDFHYAGKCYESTLVSAIISKNTLLEVEALKGIGDSNLEKGKITKNATILEDAVSFYTGALSRCEHADGQQALLHRIRYAKKIKEQILIVQSKCLTSREKSRRKAKAKLSAVAEELRELDTVFKSGSDLNNVERGYACKLIHAISSEDEALEYETLKSLGDVYLQRAKMKKYRMENFNKACLLYTELLKYRAGKEQRQVIQHRIKYAEKCTGLKHNPKRAKSEMQTSANITLDVAETLQKVEERTKTRHGAMPLVESYANLFVNSIANRNGHLQIESLKSLGDLYLEKGKVGKDDTAFMKAAGLYRAALERCEDSNGEETLKRRIEYMKKVKKRQRLTPSRTRKADSDNTPPPTLQQATRGRTTEGDKGGTYKDHLQWGDKALQKGDLNSAEQHFAAALKSVNFKESSTSQQWKEAEPLYKLSNVYLKRGLQSKDGWDFTKAAALGNAALVRSTGNDKEGIKQTIVEVTQSFVKYVLGIDKTISTSDAEKHKLLLMEHRGYVKKEMQKIEEQIDPYSIDDDNPKIREVEKNRAEAMKELFQTIAHERRELIAGLVNECMEVMGPPPCKYAMIGLGSQATGLVTPYSDLEFAILIEEESDSNVKYFRNLTHYLHLKVINLGETILPAMGIKSLNDFFSDDPLDNWYYDSATPRGFAFDGEMPKACKTPLGRGKESTGTKELIQTPDKLISVLKNDVTFHFTKGYHLSSILGNVCFITGEHRLVDDYVALWAEQRQVDNGIIPFVIAKLVLIENAPAFQTHPITDSLINAKKDIYRFSSLAVSCWALLRNIQPTTIWETIQKMTENGVISRENAHHLMVVVSISGELRLRTYMNNRGQVDNMSALLSIDGDTGEKLKKVFYIPNTKQLLRYYYTARPLKNYISQLTTSHHQPSEVPLILFDTSARAKSEIHSSLLDYQSWKTCEEQALQNYIAEYSESTAHPDIADSLNNLGNVSCRLGDYRKAVSYYEQSLHMRRLIHTGSTAHPDIAGCLTNLGSAWANIGDHRKAVRYYEQSLQMRRSIYGESTAHPDIANSLHNLGNVWIELGDNRKAISIHEQALQMKRSMYGESTANHSVAISMSSLGSAWAELGDYVKSISYYEQALRLRRCIYGDSTAHPDIADSLNNLGNTYSELGNYQKAVSYFEQSLHIKRKIYGDNTAHPDIAMSLNNLGNAWTGLGEHRKALFYHEQSLHMKRNIYGDHTQHLDIAVSFNNLASVWSYLGNYRKALRYFEQSLQTQQCIYGKTTEHPDVAASLNNLGNVSQALGDHRKAISYYEESLLMRRAIYGETVGHPEIAASLNNLAMAWAKTGDHRKGFSYCEQALQMMRTIYGESTVHPSIAASLNNLGNISLFIRDYRQAVSYYEQALHMMRCIYEDGMAHPDIANSLNNLGYAWSKLGNNRKSVSYCEQALKMMRIIYGHNTAHTGIYRSLYNLGSAWKNLGDYGKAVSYLDQAAQIKKRVKMST